MANTYTQIHLHVVFAVKYRASCIPAAHAARLYRYTTGIVTAHGQKLLAINGMPDHLHLLIGLRPDMALSDLMRDVKASSAKFINEQNWLPGKFAWQEGFGAFSYSASQLPTVITYIERQKEHHAKRGFLDEYRSFLKKFTVPFEDKYLFQELEERLD
ncbi:IS200/IS605 family transposase [Hymenobacter caeli]|uniref:REP element-mobilizing transposase RayT n=1 Tax=Hymenobacter caeli TaxID=2735894 RepID=A0ABX2FQD2_9BACT|nr:IS200/IS605 family transposase [Hymenobacter caeli]NRT19211.1 REP element-mobilizing transposase RayT [Hymenobacter caeli]